MIAWTTTAGTHNTRTDGNPEAEIQLVLDGNSHSGNVFYSAIQ